jgi:hypothetical protein
VTSWAPTRALGEAATDTESWVELTKVVGPTVTPAPDTDTVAPLAKFEPVCAPLAAHPRVIHESDGPAVAL